MQPLPYRIPYSKNLILAGNGESKQGIRLRRGTQADIDNAKVCGKGQPLVVESALTNASLKNGTSRLTNMTVTAALKSDGDYTNDDFTAVTSNKVDATLSYASFDAIKAACDWMKGNWINNPHAFQILFIKFIRATACNGSNFCRLYVFCCPHNRIPMKHLHPIILQELRQHLWKSPSRR